MSIRRRRSPRRPASSSSPLFMTVSEAARSLHFNHVTTRKMIHAGKLDGRKPTGKRGHWRITTTSVERLARELRKGGR